MPFKIKEIENPDELIGTEVMERHLGITKVTIRKAALAGAFPYILCGVRMKFRRSTLRHIQEHGYKIPKPKPVSG